MVIKLRRVSFAGLVGRMEKMRNSHNILVIKGDDNHIGDLGIDWNIILKEL
jgi:hypothetical protein